MDIGHQWSDDNQAEVDKGCIVQADSICVRNDQGRRQHEFDL